jgi:hypothetical protein
MAYVLNDNCFYGSTIESMDTFGGHESNSKKFTGKNIIVGVDLESRGATGAIVYVKVSPNTAQASIINAAVSRGSKIMACFESSLATQLRKELSAQKPAPRYEHQSVVEFRDISLYLSGNGK